MTTRFITNSKSIADTVGVRCPGGHRHIVLVDGRAKVAAIYPEGLCKAICRGYREHRAGLNDHVEDVARELSGRPLTTHEADVNDDVLMRPMGENLVVTDLIELLELAREEDTEAVWEAFDDIHGVKLPVDLVIRARLLEMEYMRKRNVYKLSTVATAVMIAGHMISTMWIDTNKGDVHSPSVRCRFVAKEYRRAGYVPIFAAAPPLETLRVLVRICAANQKRKMSERHGMICIDVSRAHVSAEALLRPFIKLPPEDPATHRSAAN